MGFPRQEYCSELPFSSPGDLPDPRIETASPAPPALQADSSPSEPSGKHDTTKMGDGKIHQKRQSESLLLTSLSWNPEGGVGFQVAYQQSRAWLEGSCAASGLRILIGHWDEKGKWSFKTQHCWEQQNPQGKSRNTQDSREPGGITGFRLGSGFINFPDWEVRSHLKIPLQPTQPKFTFLQATSCKTVSLWRESVWGCGARRQPHSDNLIPTTSFRLLTWRGGGRQGTRDTNSGIPILACSCPPRSLQLQKQFHCRQVISQACCWQYME